MNETQHGTRPQPLRWRSCRKPGWVGLQFASICAAGRSAARKTMQPRPTSTKRTISLQGMYPNEQTAEISGTSLASFLQLEPRSNEMWRRRQLPCEPASPRETGTKIRTRPTDLDRRRVVA